MYFTLNSVFSVTALNFMPCLVNYADSAGTLTATVLSFFCYAFNEVLYFILGRHRPVVIVNCWQTNPQKHNTRIAGQQIYIYIYKIKKA